MCQNPSTNPNTGDTFACRNCDACISQRRFDWVSRAMAEKHTSAQTICLTLTYDNSTQENREGAMMFRYSDVQAFFKRLRDHIKTKTGKTGSLRYIVAGEQGDRHGRCHWHIVLFSQVDLLELGEISTPYSNTPPEKIVTGPGERPIRLHWSIWGRGFVTFQQPDEGGIHYALTYALKDQFAGDKARGTNREAKSETFATGLFRMSKFPPIGQAYLDQRLSALRAMGAVLPSTKIRVPGLRGYWRPSGMLRKYLLTNLRDINHQVKEATGRNAPQWSSLVAACKNSDKDLEALHGEEIEDDELADTIQRNAARKREDQQVARDGYVRRRCGSTAPCNGCLSAIAGFEPDGSRFERFERDPENWSWRYAQNDPKGDTLRRDQRDGKCAGQNRLCQTLPSAPEIVRAFPATVSAPRPSRGFAASSYARAGQGNKSGSQPQKPSAVSDFAASGYARGARG